jgi:Virulence activator alpha C-term
MEREQFPVPAGLDAALRDRWLVLRGGIRLERFWIDWITEYLQAHEHDAGTPDGEASA